MHTKIAVGVGALVVLGVGAYLLARPPADPGPAQQPLPAGPVTVDRAALTERVRAMLPTPEEDRWLQVPWHNDLLAARAEAMTSGKPLFMWLMDGNPLGST